MVWELIVSVLVVLFKDKLLVVVFFEGVVNFYVVILLCVLGIFVVMGVLINLCDLNGKKGIVDGYSGKLFILFLKIILNEYCVLVNEECELLCMVNEVICEFVCIFDGVWIELLLNAGLSVDISIVVN